MSRERTVLQRASGKLVLAIQKEWGAELSGPAADASEQVMHTAHDFLPARTAGELRAVLGSLTVRQYLGESWISRHTGVEPFIDAVENALVGSLEPEDRD